MLVDAMLPAPTCGLMRSPTMDAEGARAILVAVGMACVGRLWWHAMFVVLWAALALAGLVAVYYSSTAPIDWYLTYSADRVVFSVVLALATVAPVLTVLAWAGMAGDSAEKRRSP